jgi:hypothetical protein
MPYVRTLKDISDNKSFFNNASINFEIVNLQETVVFVSFKHYSTIVCVGLAVKFLVLHRYAGPIWPKLTCARMIEPDMKLLATPKSRSNS